MFFLKPKKYIALTFDDGPSYTNSTTQIIKILKDNRCVATFFVIGKNAYKNQEKLIDIIDANCEIGNHTWFHEKLCKISNNEIIESIKKTQDVIEKITGIKPILARPTGGNINVEVSNIYKNFNLFIINWSIDTKDWKSRNKDEIISEALDNVKDGDIVLMHDIYEETASALDTIIKELKKRGYYLVTVSKLMEIKKVKMQYNKIYFSSNSLRDIK